MKFRFTDYEYRAFFHECYTEKIIREKMKEFGKALDDEIDRRLDEMEAEMEKEENEQRRPDSED